MSEDFISSDARWLHEPDWRVVDGELEMRAREGSDFWRHTSYGFVHDSGHALLRPLGPGRACEVDVLASMSEQFDQAGLLVRVSESHWLKAGLELADGALGVGAVYTDGRSDWSTTPVPWSGRWVRFRISRGPDALTVRARPEGGEWQLVRVVPFPVTGEVSVGPFACSPTRDGYVARFRDLSTTDADRALH